MTRTGYRKDDSDGQNRSKNRNSRNYRPTSRPEFAGWVNAAIPASDRDKFEQWAGSTLLLDAAEKQAKAGMSVTLSWSDDEETFVAKAFCQDGDSPNAGLMVSQRSEEGYRALCKLWYVLSEVLPADWTPLVGGTSDRW